MDGKIATMSIRAVEVDGEGMTARLRRYECLVPGNLQGAVHMPTKRTRKMVLGQDEHGSTRRPPLRSNSQLGWNVP